MVKELKLKSTKKKVAEKQVKETMPTRSSVQVTEKPTELKVETEKVEKISKETQMIVKIVVDTIRPDMESAIAKHFDANRTMILNEIKDIRTMIENGKDLELTQVGENQAVPPVPKPSNEKGEKNAQTRYPPTVQQPPAAENNNSQYMELILKVLPELLKSKQETQPDPVMVQMHQMILQKAVNDMGKQDTTSTAMTNYLLKLLIKKDPDILGDVPTNLG